MSSITKPHTLPARLHRNATLWLAGGILATAVILVLALTITSTDAEKGVTTAGPAQAVPGQRSDGAPEGYKRVFPGPPVTDERYDGGPEEGTRGATPAPPADIHRYDGGPEEGTRDPTRFSGPR